MVAKKITIEQIRNFYQDKQNAKCPITEAFIKLGYQQKSDGYIKYAHEKKVKVDYTEAEPSQWWHLIEAYCNNKNSDDYFTRRIKCGELYIWMAEVSGAVNSIALKKLIKKAIKKAKKIDKGNKCERKIEPSKESNELIRDYCYDKIIAKINK